MHDRSHSVPIRSKNNPNLFVYIYEDSGVDNIPTADRTYDSFTGLRDKQYLLKVLKKRMEDSVKSGKELSFAMFDMDNFKSINELLGYETGDDFIRIIGDSVSSVAKENNISAYRFGGEEFIIIFNNQDKAEQKRITDKVLADTNSNGTIRQKEDEYMENARGRMANYEMSTARVSNLLGLKSKKELYDDLLANLETPEAKNDPYLLKNAKKTEEELNSQYISLASERMYAEDDVQTQSMLLDILESYRANGKLSRQEMLKLDDYLKFCFDKSAELFQTKKWLKDFLDNDGFSITGSVVDFKPEFIKGKTPMQLVGVAGESLKQGKQCRKGRSYYSEKQ